MGQVDRDGLADAEEGSGAQSISIGGRKDAQKAKPEMKSEYGKFTFYGGSYLKAGPTSSERFYAVFEPNPNCPCPEDDRFWTQQVRVSIMIEGNPPDVGEWSWDKPGTEEEKAADPKTMSVYDIATPLECQQFL